MRLSGILTPVAAGLLAATGLLLAPAQAGGAPARAASSACPGATGVTVVVDFNELPAGEEMQVGCDAAPSRYAVDNFAKAGFALTEHPTQQGYTCKVNGRPADGDCLANDAFWSLWWSDGKSGKWVFATKGVTTLRVPTGGYVAFSWHQGGGTATAPDAVPTPRAATATPTPSAAPSSAATKGSGTTGGGTKGGGTKNGGTTTGSAGTSATPSRTPTSTATATPSGSPSASASTGTATPTEATSSATPGVEDITAGPETDTAHTDDEGSTFPTWLGVGLGVGVLGAAGAVPLVRRRLG